MGTYKINFEFIVLCSISILAFIPICAKADGGATLIAGAISAGASLIGTTVDTLSSNGPNRNVVIEISNHMEDENLYGGHYFLQWGWSSLAPQTAILKKTKEAASFIKVPDTATGTAGIIEYKIGNQEDPARFIVVWSIPYNYIHASNWFGLKFIGDHEKVNKGMFDDVWDSPAWKNPKVWEHYGYAYEGKPVSIFHNDYIISASMSNLGRSILTVNVKKIPGGFGKNGKFFRQK